MIGLLNVPREAGWFQGAIVGIAALAALAPVINRRVIWESVRRRRSRGDFSITGGEELRVVEHFERLRFLRRLEKIDGR